MENPSPDEKLLLTEVKPTPNSTAHYVNYIKLRTQLKILLKKTLQIARKRLIKYSSLLLGVSMKILSKLKNAKKFCGFNQRFIKNLTLDEFYKEISQDGLSIFPISKNQTFNNIEMKLFGRKIMTTPGNDKKRIMMMQS